MSKRVSIVKALAEVFKTIDGTSPYTTNLTNNSYPKLKFWDEVNDFPAVYVHPTSLTYRDWETRLIGHLQKVFSRCSYSR